MWNERVEIAENLIRVLRHGNVENKRQAYRVRICLETRKRRSIDDSTKLQICNHRLCPWCSAKKAVQRKSKYRSKVKRILELNPRYGLVFLTLTWENPLYRNLSVDLAEKSKAWKKLTKRKVFADVVGWMKVVEITEGQIENHCHPHIHCLIIVRSGFFGRGYINSDAWRDEWQLVANLPYAPQVHQKNILKPGQRSEAQMEAAMDMVEYACKEEIQIRIYSLERDMIESCV